MADQIEHELLTIDIDDKPTLVLSARNWQLIERAGRDWFQADLSLYSCAGVPLTGRTSILRPSTKTETAIFERSGLVGADQAEYLKFLVPLDDCEE